MSWRLCGKCSKCYFKGGEALKTDISFDFSPKWACAVTITPYGFCSFLEYAAVVNMPVFSGSMPTAAIFTLILSDNL